MPTPQHQQTAVEHLLDEQDLVSPEDEAALAAEQVEEPAEPAPEQLPAKQPVQEAVPAKAKPATPKTIPYERFSEIVAERNKIREELLATRDREARLDERAKMAQEAEQKLAQQRQQEEAAKKIAPRPDETIDPMGAQLWDRDRAWEQRLAEERAENERRWQQTNQQIGQTREQQEFNNWLTTDVEHFKTEHNDYLTVADQLYKLRVATWEDAGFTNEQARNIVNNEAAALSQAARANGRSAAAIFYKLGQTFSNGNTANQPVATGAQPAQERVRQIKAAQKVQGLGSIPQERTDNIDWSNLTQQQIADMPEEDFLEVVNADTPQGKQLRRAIQRYELGG